MVVVTVAHLLRVFFYGAYKYPREATWITGVFLLLIVIGFGFTGYLLPWDQKAFWATTVGTRIAGVAPGIGDWICRYKGGRTIGGHIGAFLLSISGYGGFGNSDPYAPLSGHPLASQLCLPEKKSEP
jgi:hypothetical protein